jgi:transcriptional adapter 2-alpha
MNDIDAQKRGNYRCTYCHKDVTTNFRVQCAVCVDFYLCTECFSAGVVLKPHESWHDYKIADCWEMPIFEKGWSINEELTLLDG